MEQITIGYGLWYLLAGVGALILVVLTSFIPKDDSPVMFFGAGKQQGGWDGYDD